MPTASSHIKRAAQAASASTATGDRHGTSLAAPSRQLAVPQRTCVGCKLAVAQSSLWRAVADAAGRLRFDSTRRATGRGVYIHRHAECLQAALRGGFSRSLRRKVVVTDAAVLSELGLPGRTSPGKSGLAPDLLAASTPARVENQDNHS